MRASTCRSAAGVYTQKNESAQFFISMKREEFRAKNKHQVIVTYLFLICFAPVPIRIKKNNNNNKKNLR